MKILVCPLDWGLGHAARCVPLIRNWRALGHTVTPAASGRSREFLAGEFPDLEILDFPGISPRLSGGKQFVFHFLARLPGFVWRIAREHRDLQKLVIDRRFDLVVSDGRIGLFTRLCPSILITHQLFIKFPPWEFIGVHWERSPETISSWVLRLFFRLFGEIWIPDFSTPPDLAGRLSHRRTSLKRIRYIGPLCRFSAAAPGDPPSAGIDCLALVSGPEPQRTIFEGKLKAILRDMPGRRVLLLGKPEEREAGRPAFGLDARSEGLRIVPHADEETLRRLILSAGLVVARSGYTTVMELAGLGARHVLFVPTPGQTEQHYLARYLQDRGIAPWRAQECLHPSALRIDEAAFRGFREFPARGEIGRRIPLPKRGSP